MALETGRRPCAKRRRIRNGWPGGAINLWRAPLSSHGRGPRGGRGKFTTKPGEAFPTDMARRALFLVPEAPYPLYGGGALRSASLLEYLSRRYDVDVIVFREPSAPDPAQLFPAGLAREIHVIELPRHNKGLVARSARNALRLARGVPPLIDRFGGFSADIAGFLDGRRYDLAVVEHFWCAPYLEQVSRASAKTVLDLHNIESLLHQRCARIGSGPEALAHSLFQRAARDLE